MAGPGAGDEVVDFVRGTRLKIAGLTTFKKGAEVRIVGLEFHPQLNGRVGTVAGFDDARKRWAVDMGEGLGKKLFLESNMSPAVVEALLPPAPPAPPPRDEAASAPPSAQGGAAAGAEGDDEVVELFEGARVRVQGLGAKNAELNGSTGTLLEYHAERQRWIVELEGDHGRKMLRAANLVPAAAGRTSASGPGRPAGAPGALLEAREPPSDAAPGTAPRGLRPGCQVLLQGLVGEGLEHLNGQVGVCEHCEFMTGCWTVFFSSGVKAKLRPEYFVIQPPTLRPGAYVRLHGLQNAKQLNGRMGICGRLDAESLRWEVHLDTGENKSLKEENLEPQEGYNAHREEGPTEQNLAATFEAALQSGEISWLDC